VAAYYPKVLLGNGLNWDDARLVYSATVGYMKQLFSAYPAGFAGSALLLFRASMALFLTVSPPRQFTSHLWPALVVDVIAIAIGIGLYTRIFALLSAFAGLIFAVSGACTEPMLLVTHAFDAVALALIGPGAFSLDARLFGRATINLPR
jgi:hypothetical protein